MTSNDLPYGFEPLDYDDSDSSASHSTERRPQTIPEFVRQMKETADKFIRDAASRGDVKMMNTAFKELRYALKVFSVYRDRRKVPVFGSARTKTDDPSYTQAIELGRRMAE